MFSGPFSPEEENAAVGLTSFTACLSETQIEAEYRHSAQCSSPPLSSAPRPDAVSATSA